MSKRSIFEMNYLVHQIAEESGDIIETLAAANNFDAADAALTALERTQGPAVLQLRYRSGIVKTVKLGRFDRDAGACEVIWRMSGGPIRPELQPRPL